MSETNDNKPEDQLILPRLVSGAAAAGESLQSAFDSIAEASACLNIDQATCDELSAEMERWELALDSLQELLDTSNLSIRKTPQQEANTEPNELLDMLAEQALQIAALQAQLLEINNPQSTSSSRHTESDTRVSLIDPYLNRVVIAADTDGNLKFPLDKNIITIGRETVNDIHIHSRFISRFHARIVSDRQGAIIEDLDSRNGVKVNSRRVLRQQLRSGDLISVGHTQLQYIDLTEGIPSEAQA